MTILKFRYLLVVFGTPLVSFFSLIWAESFYIEHGLFGGICSYTLSIAFCEIINRAADVVAFNLLRQTK